MHARDCPVFRPDHNGECLNCDEWMDEHTPEAIAAGEAAAANMPLTDGVVDAFLATAPPSNPDTVGRIRTILEGLSHPHAQLAQDTWRLIRALAPDPTALLEMEPAAMSLIELACDAAAESERFRRDGPRKGS